MPRFYSIGNDPGLPPGITQRACDGPPDNFADAAAQELWHACSPPQQQAIASDFSLARADDLRDALLELGRALRPQPHPANLLGMQLLRSWILFRDRQVNLLHRRGFISPPAPRTNDPPGG